MSKINRKTKDGTAAHFIRGCPRFERLQFSTFGYVEIDTRDSAKLELQDVFTNIKKSGRFLQEYSRLIR